MGFPEDSGFCFPDRKGEGFSYSGRSVQWSPRGRLSLSLRFVSVSLESFPSGNLLLLRALRDQSVASGFHLPESE